MKNFIIILSLVITAFILWLTFSVKIPVSYVGIKVNMYWDAKGVSVFTLPTGRSAYNPFMSDVYKYPVFVQQKEYSQVRFQDSDWLVIGSNIWLDYQFKSESVSKFFEQYRASANKITDELMSTWLRNAVNRASAKFKVDEIYWPKKEEFRLLVLENLKQDFDDKGIIVNNIYLVGDMELPPQVMSRITAKSEATQTAMQKENELRTVEAEVQKQIAEAKWYAEATLIRARAETEAIKIKSQAIQSQWWADYIKLQEIDKWNWVLPTITGVNYVWGLPFTK